MAGTLGVAEGPLLLGARVDADPEDEPGVELLSGPGLDSEDPAGAGVRTGVSD